MEQYTQPVAAVCGIVGVAASIFLCVNCRQGKTKSSQEDPEDEKPHSDDKEKVNTLETESPPAGNVGTQPEGSCRISESRDSVSWTPAPRICGAVDYCRQSYGYISPNPRGSQRTSSDREVGSLGRDSNNGTMSTGGSDTINVWKKEIERMSVLIHEDDETKGGSDASSYDTAEDGSNLSEQDGGPSLGRRKRKRRSKQKSTFNDSVDVNKSSSDSEEGYSIPPTSRPVKTESPYQVPKLLLALGKSEKA